MSASLTPRKIHPRTDIPLIMGFKKRYSERLKSLKMQRSFVVRRKISLGNSNDLKLKENNYLVQ